MTTSVNTAPDQGSTTDAAGCAQCPHPSGMHDEIGARFCAATVAGQLDRGCACATGESTR